MGSLGFLTPFDFKSHEKILNEVISGNVAVLLRTRLKCTIVKEGLKRKSSSQTSFRSMSSEDGLKDEKKPLATLDDKISHLALNEVVIDRGPNSYLSNLDLYINDRFITKVQGDGKARETLQMELKETFAFRFNHFDANRLNCLCDGR